MLGLQNVETYIYNMKKKKIKLTESELNLITFSIIKAITTVAPKSTVANDLEKLYKNVIEQRFN